MRHRLPRGLAKGESFALAQIGDIFRLKKERPRSEEHRSKKKRKKRRSNTALTQPSSLSRTDLTAEQLKVVGLPPEARALVVAGPGTGKTHVLIARLAELVNQYGLQPGRELLVLSFSRAAVGEIRKRVTAAGGDIRYTRTFTFDSFATRLLSQIDPEGNWISESYDGRIRCATSQILDNLEAKAIIEGFSHILVDEIQDLVGDRAELVRAVLDVAIGGFTLLGDPAQGIYGFQLPKPLQHPSGSQKLFSALRRRYSPSIQQFTLAENHRVKTQSARSAVAVGARLNGFNPDYDVIARELEAIIAGLPTVSLPQLESSGLLGNGLSTAVLCRTNAQALVISRNLSHARIEHVYQRSATDRVVPSWLGTVFGSWSYGQIGRRAFVERLESTLGDGGPHPDEAWSLLKRIEGRTGNTLDIAAISTRIASGNIPDELNLIEKGRLTVSTIHRAKGLEFDRVILVEPQENGNQTDVELADKARLLYVALTRPRQELLRTAAPDTRSMYRLGYDERWAKRYGGWRLLSVEIKGQDIHSQDPAGGYLLKVCNPPEIQEYLQSEVKVGDSVELKRISVSSVGHPRAFYSILHNGTPIGVTSERFGQVLHSIIKANESWQVQWPMAITDVRVEAIDTVAGTIAAGQSSGLNGTGLWLRARVAGLGNVKWR